MREAPLQIAAFASQVEEAVSGFSKPVYPDWESLFISLNNVLKDRTVICLDEFPYLVKQSPELPSVLQKLMDKLQPRNFHLVLCGSSQHMMHSMVLDITSPLYGRCDEIIRVRPMEIRNMKEFLSLSSIDAVREFGVWGGVPRYWEIRQQYHSFDEAVKMGVLDRDGLLYEEPERIFLDEMRTSVQAYSILSLIGAGVHRPSEIAARLGKPLTHLSHVFGFLITQGYIRREIPFGESTASSKRNRYKIEDSFLNFYFTFLVPNRSRLESDMSSVVWRETKKAYDQYISFVWEDLCRKVVPCMDIEGVRFNPARRWWGGGLDKKPLEIDIVATSLDNDCLLIAEVKWTDRNCLDEVIESLNRKAGNIPFKKPGRIIRALFQKVPATHPEISVFTPDDIIEYSLEV